MMQITQTVRNKTMILDKELTNLFLKEKGQDSNQKIISYFKDRDEYIIGVVNDTIKNSSFQHRCDINEQVKDYVVSVYDYIRKNQMEIMKYFLKIKNL